MSNANSLSRVLTVLERVGGIALNEIEGEKINRLSNIITTHLSFSIVAGASVERDHV